MHYHFGWPSLSSISLANKVFYRTLGFHKGNVYHLSSCRMTGESACGILKGISCCSMRRLEPLANLRQLHLLCCTVSMHDAHWIWVPAFLWKIPALVLYAHRVKNRILFLMSICRLPTSLAELNSRNYLLVPSLKQWEGCVRNGQNWISLLPGDQNSKTTVERRWG